MTRRHDCISCVIVVAILAISCTVELNQSQTTPVTVSNSQSTPDNSPNLEITPETPCSFSQEKVDITLHFNIYKTDLTSDYYLDLESLYRVTHSPRAKLKKLTINGYEFQESNTKGTIAQARADNVKNAFINLGTNPDLILTTGHTKHPPWYYPNPKTGYAPSTGPEALRVVWVIAEFQLKKCPQPTNTH